MPPPRTQFKVSGKKVQKFESDATNISQNLKFLNEDQVRALSKSSSLGNSWSADTVKQGLQIKFACGTTGYETLRKMGYSLPSNRTLARRIQSLKFLPGILHEVIDDMKCKAESMEDVEKDCIFFYFFFDEMEIVPGFELDRAEDTLLGGVTLPPKPEEPANHALVFMLGGLNQRWKQVIAHEFTGRNVDGCPSRPVLNHYAVLFFYYSLTITVKRPVAVLSEFCHGAFYWRNCFCQRSIYAHK